jgi:tetratricopeptide (TPR) repeat protein
MKKSASANFIPQMLGFLLLLGSFFSVLLFLKNPDSKPLEPTRAEAELVKKVKPRAQMIPATEQKTSPLRGSVVASGKADELYQKAVIAAREHEDEEIARRLLQEALQENPNHIGAADELYASYEKRQDWEGALAAFQKMEADKRDGSAAGLEYGLGRLYLALGHPDQARLRLEEALESDTDNPLIREQLASAYDSLGERDWARREWQSLAQDESAGRASINAKIKLAEDFFAEGRWAEAEAYAKEILKQDPQNRLGTLLSEH